MEKLKKELFTQINKLADIHADNREISIYEYSPDDMIRRLEQIYELSSLGEMQFTK